MVQNNDSGCKRVSIEQKYILVVDDSKVVRSLISKAFKRCEELKIELVMAESYAQAQELIKVYEFAVAILDVHLPDAQEGEVIDLLLAENVPVIVLTGGMNKTTKQLILQKDIVEYITKSNPQSIEYIIAVVKRILKNYDSYVLVVDDSKVSRSMIKKHLQRLYLNVLEASDGIEALKIVDEIEEPLSLILTDYEMPNLDGMELTLSLRQNYSKDRLSIIAVSASDNSKLASEFLRHGANDFIKKPFTHEEFAARINVNLELLELFAESKDSANKDFMTGMYNRRYFFESGNQIIDKNARKDKPVAVAMLDIDFFKKINDTYGHDAGDMAIKEVALILAANLRKSDLVSRFGGEEFCILLEDITLENLEKKFERIRSCFEQNSIRYKELSFTYTVSIGLYFGKAEALEKLINKSDEALYEAKENGRNKVVIHTQEDVDV